MSGSFIQIVDDNEMRNGNFYFLKPYLAKFVYDNRNEDIITNERLLRIVDKEGNVKVYKRNVYKDENGVKHIETIEESTLL